MNDDLCKLIRSLDLRALLRERRGKMVGKYKIEDCGDKLKTSECAVKTCHEPARYKCTTDTYHARRDKWIERARLCCKKHGEQWAQNKEVEV